MVWVVVAGVVALTLIFWQKIVTWANQVLAGWLGNLFGEELREAFLMLVAAGDKFMVIAQRSALRAAEVGQRLLRARLIFRQIDGGRAHEKVIQAEIRQDDGQIVQMEAAEVVPWHELPDEVREKFIRRQSAEVELELKMKQ
jgi:hypothetical protein